MSQPNTAETARVEIAAARADWKRRGGEDTPSCIKCGGTPAGKGECLREYSSFIPNNPRCASCRVARVRR
jgi:hypothetical protein